MITGEIRACIGIQSQPTVIEIERSMIKRFAEAIEDPNPLWQDEEYARNARNGGIVAPPGFLISLMMRGPMPELPFELPFTRLLDGGGEWEYFKPIRPGDVITVVTRLADVMEREGKMGTMVFLVTETTWKNQRNELIARSRGTSIRY